MGLDGREQVLVFPAEAAQAAVWNPRPCVQLVRGWDDPLIPELGTIAALRPRTEALEKDERFVQAVVYTLLLRQRSKAWLYARTRSGTEGRLCGLLSVGVGGHVNVSDLPEPASPPNGQNLAETLRKAARREIVEETGIAWLKSYGSPPLKLLGLITSRSSPVDRVHLGFVLAARCDTVPDPEPAEDSGIEDMGWMTWSGLERFVESIPDQFESWSRLVIENIRVEQD